LDKSFRSNTDGTRTLGNSSSHWDDVFSETFTLRGSGGNTSTSIFSIIADDSSLNGMEIHVPTSREIQFHIGTVEIAHFGGSNLIMEHHAITAVNSIFFQNTPPSDSVSIRTVGTTPVSMDFVNSTAGSYDFQLSGTSRFIINNSDIDINLDLDIADGVNLVLDTTTGTKIATGTTQKLGFWNATPVTQGPAYTVTNLTADRTYDANATTVEELADVLGTLLSDLKTQGLFA